MHVIQHLHYTIKHIYYISYYIAVESIKHNKINILS